MRDVAKAALPFVLVAVLLPAVSHGAGTDVRDCGPDRLPRDVESLSDRAAVERRCTRVVAHGVLGPFRIGDAKRDVLAVLAEAGVTAIELRPAAAPELRAGDAQLEQAFAEAEGLTISAEGDPDPLRVELSGDAIARTWGGSSRLDDLRAELSAGHSRADLFESLRAHGRRRSLTVRAYVPGGRNLSVPPQPDVAPRVLAASVWRFDALAPLCPFVPFYSRVDLVFGAARLKRIEHFCFPYELPQ